jgi:exonuclease SbcC
MTSADATLLIGLTYENFRRNDYHSARKVQGVFDLKGKDRSI